MHAVQACGIQIQNIFEGTSGITHKFRKEAATSQSSSVPRRVTRLTTGPIADKRKVEVIHCLGFRLLIGLSSRTLSRPPNRRNRGRSCGVSSTLCDGGTPATQLKTCPLLFLTQNETTPQSTPHSTPQFNRNSSHQKTASTKPPFSLLPLVR